MKHNVTIDRLRGCSVFVVFLLHYGIFYPNAFAFLGSAIGNGYYGVTAFFCVSGFLITSNLLKRYDRVDRVDLYAFYVRRFGRIVPPLALLLVVLSLLSMTAIKSFNFPPPFSLKESLLYVLTLRYNVYLKFCCGTMPMWGVLWSLSIEEVFYLVYPLTAKVTRRPFWLIVVLSQVVVFAPLYRLRGTATLYEYFGCFDGIAIGALSALAAQRLSGKVIKPASWALMAFGILVLVYTYLTTNLLAQYPVTLTVIALGAALVLFASQCAPFADTRPFSFDPLVYLGRLSYEMYLFHVTIFALLKTVINPRFFPHRVSVFVVVFLCVLAVSDFISRFLSEPLNRWLRIRLLLLRKGRAAGVAALEHVPVLPGFPGMRFIRPLFLCLFCAQSAYAIRKVSPFFETPETTIDVPQHLESHTAMYDLIIHNPQGVDGAGDAVFYWIGPDITVEVLYRPPPGNAEHRFSLVFNAGAGPSNSARARRLVLRGSKGSEQLFDFVNTAVGHFNMNLHPGRNVYTLKVAYPTKMNVEIPTDARLFLVRADHFALTEPPSAESKTAR